MKNGLSIFYVEHNAFHQSAFDFRKAVQGGTSWQNNWSGNETFYFPSITSWTRVTASLIFD